MRGTRTVTCLHVIPYMLVGGAQTFAVDLADALSECVHVVAYTEPFHPTVHIPQRLGTRVQVVYVPDFGPPEIDLLRPDVVFYHWWPELTCIVDPARTKHRPLSVVWLHDSRTPVPQIDGVHYFAVSRYCADFHSHVKVARVMNACIDLDRFGRYARETHGGGLVVGRISTSSAMKFPEDLEELYLTMDIPNARYVLMDGGPLLHKRGLDPSIEPYAAGSFSAEELLATFDVFFYKTRDDCVETWPRVVAEAMASGLPVAAERKGGVAEQVVDGHSGFLCDTNEDFVRAIRHLAGDPDLRREMGTAARELAGAWGIQTLRSNVVGFLEEEGRRI